MGDEEILLNYNPEDILVRNLRLLRYDEFMEGHHYSVELDTGMFRKTNAKAMESILYFLLS